MKKDIKEEPKRKLREIFHFESQDLNFGIYRIMSRAGFVMANGALSVGRIKREIRKRIIEDDLIYGTVATPPKLFYTVSLPSGLRFLRKTKPEHIKGKMLFKALGIVK